MSEIIKPTDESALHKIKDIDVKKYIDAFTEYRTAREAYDMKIIENENWFRQQYWQYLIDKTEGNEPTSGTLLNAILNKHADLMDNQPAPVFLAREKNDEEEAERLTKVVPVIMQNANGMMFMISIVCIKSSKVLVVYLLPGMIPLRMGLVIL